MPSNVYFTDFHTTAAENQLQKLKRLMPPPELARSTGRENSSPSKFILASRGTWRFCGPIMPGLSRMSSRSWAASRF